MATGKIKIWTYAQTQLLTTCLKRDIGGREEVTMSSGTVCLLLQIFFIGSLSVKGVVVTPKQFPCTSSYFIKYFVFFINIYLSI